VLEVFEELHSSEEGLGADEVKKRLAQHGPNELPEPPVPGALSVFLSQFLSPLIYILVGAAVIVLALGEIADAVIIFFVLVFNAIVGTIQEGKAQNTLRALRKFVETSAAVVRDGNVNVVPDKEVVPGDVLLLEEGIETISSRHSILSLCWAAIPSNPFAVALYVRILAALSHTEFPTCKEVDFPRELFPLK